MSRKFLQQVIFEVITSKDRNTNSVLINKLHVRILSEAGQGKFYLEMPKLSDKVLDHFENEGFIVYTYLKGHTEKSVIDWSEAYDNYTSRD